MTIDRRQFLAGAGLGMVGSRAAAVAAGREQEDFSFCIVADPHLSETPKPGIEHCGSAVDKFLRCVEVAEALRTRPDFMLVLGDIHPWVLREHTSRIGLPMHAIAGNHESDPQRRQQLRDLFPSDFHKDGRESDYYSFVHKGVRFIGVCNAGLGGEHIGQFCSEVIRPRGQCEWLEAELEPTGERRVLFAHIPPERNGDDRNMYMSRNDSRWFNDLAAKRRPDLMLFGHLHGATEFYEIGGARCVNMRSCCWNGGNAHLGFAVARVTQAGIAVEEIPTGEYA